ncbi:O-antigen ligase domain-containing protein [Parasedimentitalea marina]|uniref:O-antigen ligase domain-containing protein n=1 Tax=Parasedimentitalea marina TaxID=2483033 RepID=A0A3T0N0E4_9RHOB|nr:O-antigen ligase domain-containing protein [Parasedimentitalea marina]AZV77477.1 O-antigen ligase domain-containing protein [Parasedimentitalea marina]
MNKIIPQNPAEKIVYKTLVWTWPFYAFGALYIVGPVLGWMLGCLAIVVAYLGAAVREDLRVTRSIPPVVWAWIIGMAAMLIVLWIGHVNFEFGLKSIIRSTIGWAKGWALMALFPLAGAVLPIRRAILVRGQCVVGLWILALAPLMLVAPYIGLPERIFVSPLKAVGGPGPEYFTVFLYTLDPASGAPRWQFYAPWSPFAALLGVTMVLFALEESDRRWKTIGVCAGTLLILASKSRMGLVGLVVCPAIPRLLRLTAQSWAWQGVAGLLVVAGMIADWLITSAQASVYAFKSARADSSRVRATLQRIATERWQGEAFWFGHGRVAPGSHIVEYMPIGSHHTWYGLLFVKGVAGFLALLLPFLWQFWMAASDTVRSNRGTLPLGLMLVFLLLSFGENIEIEVYLLWPSLLLMGIHAKEQMR